MDPLADPLAELERIDVDYGSGPVLERVSLTVEEGHFSGIVGPSGSGKTTLLRLLMRKVRPTKGTVRLRAGTAVAYVPQLETVNWDFPLTVRECVLMSRTAGRVLPWPSREERREVAGVLDRLGIGELADRHIRELSGGQQQRMFLARALIRRPQLMLLDEPTSGVDVSTRHEVLHLLDELNADGIAIVLTTHDLNGMAAHLPHLVCLRRRVVASGPPAQVLVPSVLEETFGARLEVLQHLGIPVVVDEYAPHPMGQEVAR
ncbi:MAG: metal ABC transporter ATP-binding protein [Acidothermales bacterium]|jgi:ABC-type Mn2+/Zn2+ transport system ATPase subunit|nr:metal ABC transporter ATP-binding protein [Acidothermales bacterium]